jgi:endonuclease YncB( thermonuclease family)
MIFTMPLIKVIFLFFLCITDAISGERINGKVFSVHDGDTLTLLIAGNQTIKIRLAQIDAPESNQAFGQQSQQSLSSMVFGKDVIVDKETIDKYGRTVGTVFLGNQDINKEQVARGMAWVYRQYLHDESLLSIEDGARQRKIGLWSDPNPVPPWEYRHGDAKLSTAKQIAGGSCGPKRYCKQMSSCEEARQYLACGVLSLDKDRDGVPCENLCSR